MTAIPAIGLTAALVLWLALGKGRLAIGVIILTVVLDDLLNF